MTTGARWCLIRHRPHSQQQSQQEGAGWAAGSCHQALLRPTHTTWQDGKVLLVLLLVVLLAAVRQQRQLGGLPRWLLLVVVRAVVLL